VSPEPARRTVVAVPDVFPDVEARALVVRTGQRDVVLLRASDATPTTLLMSLSVLGRLRGTEPGSGRAQMIPVTGYVVTGEPRPSVLRGLETALTTLQDAPTTSLGSFGAGRWVWYGSR
jgi:hypothetical protein